MDQKVKSLVLEAGQMLKEGYFGQKRVFKKGNVDLVSEYDIKIEEFLKPRLEDLYKMEVVGEESFKGDIPQNAIFLDPIDGTTNFVHHIAYNCISIGIYKEGRPLEGIVYNPILEELFWAKKVKGAFLNGEKIEVSDTSTLIDSLVATGFPYTKTQMGADYHFVIESMKKLLPLTRDIRRLGSAAIDLSYVACGRFAGFYEVNLKPWDVAAGILLVEEAGGRVSNHLGRPYRFGDIIVATNGRIHDELIAHLGKWR